ncbi:MSHA biogenesis protein MshJ [Marinobacter sp. 71-i]|uniref:MSHA biogenesis protein MshJ n=1 Tax=Marinobacter iranensis TaxID=2962607 RepID=A0ABT5YC80_9GAMM|nr:MSHA biogenesis protein MshJ [Marinobacter iranensis]MDF0751296.1 MSHA biogenesis protein MshJ [Marinobacter iranensis]
MTSALRQQFDKGATWFNERPIRERVIITITAVVLVLFAGWELWVTPVMAGNEQLRSRQVSLFDTQASLLQRQQLLTEQLSSDPSRVLRDRLAARQQRLDQLDARLAETTGRLIAPRAMVGLLRDILAAQNRLELLGVELMTPVPVFEDGPGVSEDAKGKDEGREPLLYAHDAEIVIRGGYMDVLAYLENLEAMDARLGWVLLDYDASEYPENEVRIRVRTLSLDRAWLGV